ncbi:MAG: hypothetical protein HC875_25005 [Anaerolineales bacterium]|nr:hypothetical protein [Anaerolineales bacterium]
MGHYLWPYHRSPDPNDSPEVQVLCQGVRQHYVRLDEIIGDMVAQAGEDATVVVMSDHGMGPKHTKRVHGNFWLQQHGWLSTLQTNGVRSLTNADNWLRRLGVPRDKLGRLMLRLPNLARRQIVKKAAKTHSTSVNTDQSQAYFVPIYDNVAGIRINLTGADKDHLYQKIRQELQEIVDPETGEAVVEQICQSEDYYHGPYAINIPDLIVIIKPDYGWGYQLGHYSSVVTKVIKPHLLQGDHRLDGVFIAHGPAVSSQTEPLPNLSIEDVAPTLLYLMGVPVPSDMDGRVLTEIVQSNVLAAQPIEMGQPLGFWPDPEIKFYDEIISDEDEEEIRLRLQALGYLE